MLADNAAGARSLRYGRMVDHVLEVELALAEGELIQLGPADSATRKAKSLLETSRALSTALSKRSAPPMAMRSPQLPPSSPPCSGYYLDELLAKPLNLAKLIVGSEGTLGIVTALKVRIVPKPEKTALALIAFDDLLAAMRSVKEMIAFQPLSLEMIDAKIIAAGRAAPLSAASSTGWKGRLRLSSLPNLKERSRPRTFCMRWEVTAS